MTQIQRALADYDMAMLRVLAHLRGVTLTSNRRPESIDELAEALLDPMSVRIALANLTPPARRALDALVASGGRMRAAQFARRHGHIRPMGPGRLERERPWRDPTSSAEELWYLGLIFRGFFDDDAGSGEFMFVPRDLLPKLPEPAVQDGGFSVEAVSPPERPKDGSAVLVHDVFSYLAYIQTHDVRPYADGRLGERDLTSLRARMSDGDERRLGFLRHLLDQMGFVYRQREYLRLKADPVRRWLSAAPAGQLLAIQAAWRDDPSWIDLCHVPGLECELAGDWLLQIDPVSTRRAVLSWLSRCPWPAWWSVEAFVEGVKQSDPDFQRPDGDYTSWYIRDVASGEYLAGFESWDQVEGRLLHDLLARPLYWLGITAIGASDSGSRCCLTDGGARLLGLAPEDTRDPSAAPIVIHPDLRVDLPQPLSLYTRFQLERLAALDREEPCSYRLTVESMGRAFARGIQIEQILAFLRDSSGQPVPSSVSDQLRLWAARYDMVDLQDMTLLTVRHERVLKELSSLPETRNLLARVLSPTSALVSGRDLPRLKRALRALGFLKS